MKYLQRFDAKAGWKPGYLTYDYVASYYSTLNGNYDKYDDSSDNGVYIFDEPLYKYPTLFYTSNKAYPGVDTYYNDLSTLNSGIVGVPYSNILIRFDLFDQNNNPIEPYFFEYRDGSSSNSFSIRYGIDSGVRNFTIDDSLTYSGTNFNFVIYVDGSNNEHQIRYSRFIDVRFYYFSATVFAEIIPSDSRDDKFYTTAVYSSPYESEFYSTPIFIPTQWTTNTHDEGSYFTIEWLYYPGAYLSKLTEDETPKQIQFNSENV